MEILAKLIFAHAIADYALQSEFLALNKGDKLWLMMMHSVIVGGCMAIASGFLYIGFIESGFHFIIDTLKAHNIIKWKEDKILHGLCILGYLLMLL